MLPVHPEFISPHSLDGDGVMTVIGFGFSESGACLTIPARQLGGEPLVEVWRSSLPIERGHCKDVAFARNGAVLIGRIAAEGGDTAAITARLYERILDAVHCAGYPHLLRVWNHVGAINEDDGTLERYKRFSAGRHETLTRRGFTREQFPAASAVGMVREGVSVYFLASRTPGVQIENPRQVPAYEYPPVHGPRSPSFARATVAEWGADALIFVSGTASVVGHETKHHGDVQAQLDETLRNMQAIIERAAARINRDASLDALTVAKTYIRRADDYEAIARGVTAALPRTQHLFLESDICRRDLLLEIEGVAAI